MQPLRVADLPVLPDPVAGRGALPGLRARGAGADVRALGSDHAAGGAGGGRGGVVMGLLWRLILLPFTAGFFSLLVGVALGYAFTRLLEFARG